MSSDTSFVDLIDLETLKPWLGLALSNVDEDTTLQFLITSFSQYVVNVTGIASFNEVADYVEIYDGNGAIRMFLRNVPIVSVSSVIAGSTTIPASPGLASAGWFIEGSQKSIALRTGQGSATSFTVSPYRFPSGTGNVQVTYSAGYDTVPFDLQEACMMAVGTNYRRKEWVDLASKSMSAVGGAVGTTTYRKWALEPRVVDILSFYSRYAKP